MLKKIIYITITLVLFTSSANAWGTKRVQRITLLPIEQANIFRSSKIPDGQLADTMLVQVTKLNNFQLAEFTELSKAFDDKLVDDAVFELLVTDDLKQTFTKLDAIEARSALLVEYCEVSKGQKIDFLADISIQHNSTQLKVTYKIINTKTAKVIIAKSFYDVPNDPAGVSDEITKRLVRSLWKLQNK